MSIFSFVNTNLKIYLRVSASLRGTCLSALLMSTSTVEGSRLFKDKLEIAKARKNEIEDAERGKK